MKNGSFLVFPMLLVSVMVAAAQNEKEYVLAKDGLELPVGAQYLEAYESRMQNASFSIETEDFESEGRMSFRGVEKRISEALDENKIRMSFLALKREREVIYEGGEPIEMDEPHEIAGKKVLLEKKDGKWVGQVEGGKALKDEKEEIVEVIQRVIAPMNKESALVRYGKEPRKVGDRWESDPASLPTMGAYKVNGGTYSLHFKEVKQFLGEPCAVIESSFTVSAIGLIGSDKGVHIKTTGASRTIRSLKTFVDYKHTESADVVMEGPMEGGGGMKMEGKIKVDARIVPQPEEE